MLQKYYNHKESSRQLARLIKENGHNNSTFAKAVGISEGGVRKLLDEYAPFNPKTETLISMADVLGVSMTDLIVYEECQSENSSIES